MTKPDDIPQDVWDTGHLLNKIANEVFTGSIDEVSAFVERHTEAIARAIMAEREACAQTAEQHGRVVSNELIGQACSRNIAADIRNRGTLTQA